MCFISFIEVLVSFAGKIKKNSKNADLNYQGNLNDFRKGKWIPRCFYVLLFSSFKRRGMWNVSSKSYLDYSHMCILNVFTNLNLGPSHGNAYIIHPLKMQLLFPILDKNPDAFTIYILRAVLTVSKQLGHLPQNCLTFAITASFHHLPVATFPIL